jgi:phosphoglycerate dehydrogenase-like enzyme
LESIDGWIQRWSTAILANVARGGSIDEDALVEAMNADVIGDAGLDVAVLEPLPKNSPLWDLPCLTRL